MSLDSRQRFVDQFGERFGEERDTNGRHAFVIGLDEAASWMEETSADCLETLLAICKEGQGYVVDANDDVRMTIDAFMGMLARRRDNNMTAYQYCVDLKAFHAVQHICTDADLEVRSPKHVRSRRSRRDAGYVVSAYTYIFREFTLDVARI